MQGFFQQFWEKAPGQNWVKMIDLTAKLGEINDIEHNQGSQKNPQNQVIFDSIMPSIPLRPSFLNWEKQTWYWGKKVAIFNWEWGRNSGPREGQIMPCIEVVLLSIYNIHFG